MIVKRKPLNLWERHYLANIVVTAVWLWWNAGK